MSTLHVILLTSILCFGVTFLSGTLLMIPSVIAVFTIGKTLLYNQFDINDSIIKNFFRVFRGALPLLRFMPINLIILINSVGILAAAQLNMPIYCLICLMIMALLLTFIFYIAGFYVFIDHKVQLVEVAFAMFFKPTFLVSLFSGMVIFTLFFQAELAKILLVCGSLFLFIIEIVIFVHMLYYKQFKGIQEDEMDVDLISYAAERWSKVKNGTK